MPTLQQEGPVTDEESDVSDVGSNENVLNSNENVLNVINVKFGTGDCVQLKKVSEFVGSESLQQFGGDLLWDEENGILFFKEQEPSNFSSCSEEECCEIEFTNGETVTKIKFCRKRGSLKAYMALQKPAWFAKLYPNGFPTPQE